MTKRATFTINFTHYLNENGEAVGTLPPIANDTEHLKKIYREMVTLRVFDTKAVNLQRTGRMGTYASILGQEAISTVLGLLMDKDDVLAPAYREYGAQLQRGVSMKDIYTYWGGSERGSAFDHPYDFTMAVPIASQCLHAAGAATAFKIRNEARVAVACCGDGATSQGEFYEALNVAGIWQLPVVFLVSNNQWAISVPRKKQTGTLTLAQKAIAAGFSGEQVDGNDVIALHEIFSQALNKARSGGGPTLIEAITYRLGDHTTADDASRYRSEEEVEQAWQREPIRRLKLFLEAQGHWNDEQEQRLQEEAKVAVEEAVQAYLQEKSEPAESLFDYQYEQLTDELRVQRDELRVQRDGMLGNDE